MIQEMTEMFNNEKEDESLSASVQTSNTKFNLKLF